jgi:methyl-accepting chemotaxis protein
MRSITWKIAFATSASCAAVALSLGAYMVRLNRARSEAAIEQLDGVLRSDFDRLARTQVETATSMLNAVAQLRSRGDLKPEQAEKVAAHLLRSLRYGDEGYFWADTVDGTNVVLLGRDAEGKNRLDAKDSHGNSFIRTIRDRAIAGGGYSDWWFPKKGGGEPMAKRGYSKLVEPLGWVIGTGNYLQDIEGLVATQREAARGEAARQLRIIAAIVLVAFALSVLLARYLGNRLAAPLVRLSVLVAHVGDGDLTPEVAIETDDEVGVLARSFQHMVVRLRTIVGTLKATAKELGAAAEQLSDHTRAQAAMLERQAAGVAETTSTTRELEQTAAVAATRAASVLDVASRGSEMSDQGRVTAERSAAELSHIQASIDAMVGQAAQLLGQTRQVSDIAETVRDLATQSHVLSLNASIEAARAGAAGKSFAVVAQEVRSLAEQSGSSAGRIAKMVDEIVSAVESTRATTESGSHRMSSSLEQIRAAAESLSQIGAIVRETNEAALQIASAVQQQSTAIGQIAAAMRDLDAGMEETITRLRSLELSAQRVAEAATRISAVAEQFTIKAA